MDDVDIAIIGGGLVGASAALLCARANPNWRIALIDPEPAPAMSAAGRPSFDSRSSALSAGSADCLQSLGCWSTLADCSGVIDQVHVSDRGYLPGQRLRASEFKRSALGYVVPNIALGHALFKALEQASGVHAVTDQVGQIEFHAGCAQLRLHSGSTLASKLVVVADGAQSVTRERLGIATTDYDYAQQAVIANVRVSQKHNGVAYERFTSEGPLALLPLADAHELALIWTLPIDQADLARNWSDAEFLASLQRRFGHRLGRFESVSERASYPLVRREANEQVRSRLVLVGNAAHSLHPVAGQGFNLALRDCVQLAHHLSRTDPGAFSELLAYQQARDLDQRLTTAMGDSMVRLFSRSNPLAVTLRHLGLLGLEVLPALKQRFGRQMMGLGVNRPVMSVPAAMNNGGEHG
ncbi:2-octaprenyl-6-methoxyphenyl hydroxylase [Gilvimarinus sp. SDUM040013]|uniref:2-octaprenyl-6-methoxyphenyl hydroxylase n=1 Tax=Gilvimarinus gilvus TaxID=3058038 RepID=A0ABU4RWL1_9GAMM|nr:2-octaprenyl-6-methoxyphenyl hydroxylase [Gilvimarinus sp. SDUM040013]MDO3388567.1 2-octaprenyl-6-methoxyphenyl hydroxylase [Gilvimarinus sp. SDUM040013]MDX6848561.1 2-octaprenyl-6-methoxyphenyl hydroxylase [Gilvimarinus sp. SDUM040013]